MSVDVSSAKMISGWMKESELTWLARRASSRNKIIEVGSYHGRSTIAMLSNSNAHVFCVDSWDRGDVVTDDDYNLFIENTGPYSDRLTVVRGDGAKCLSELTGHKFDMAFISYKCVKSDILGCLPLLNENAILCGHDYSMAWPDVKKAVNELVPGFKRVKGTSLWWKII